VTETPKEPNEPVPDLQKEKKNEVGSLNGIKKGGKGKRTVLFGHTFIILWSRGRGEELGKDVIKKVRAQKKRVSRQKKRPGSQVFLPRVTKSLIGIKRRGNTSHTHNCAQNLNKKKSFKQKGNQDSSNMRGMGPTRALDANKKEKGTNRRTAEFMGQKPG